jgi:outer membrane protein TolC
MIGVFMSAALALAAQVPQAPSPSAQQMAQPAALTLEDCVSRALGESPVEASAEFSVQSATHAAGAAKAPYYPSLGFNLVGSRWQRRIFLPASLSFPGQAPPTIVGPTDDYALSLNASYLLFDGGERKAQLAMARARQRAAEADQGRVRQDLVLAVHQAYFSLAAALAQREVAGKDLGRAEDHLRIAKDRKEAGTVPLVDVTRAASGVAQARLSVIRADNEARRSRGRLATAMGLGASASVDIAPSPEAPAPPNEAELASQEALALQARPALLAAAQTVEAAKQSVNKARGAFYPKLGAAAAYGHEDASWYPEDKTWYVGLSVSVPLFTGFSRTQDLAKARADLGKAEADARQAALVVREQVWDAFSALRASFEAIAAAQALTDAARESQRLARERYAVGAGPLSDLLDAETELAGAEAAQVSAEWQYRSARSQFRWSAGDLRGN